MTEKEDKNSNVTFMFNGKPFEVPPGGSLGLLAMGNIGIRAWKKAAKEYKIKEENQAGKHEEK